MTAEVSYTYLRHEGLTKWYGLLSVRDAQDAHVAAGVCLWGPVGRNTGGDVTFSNDWAVENWLDAKRQEKKGRGYRINFHNIYRIHSGIPLPDDLIDPLRYALKRSAEFEKFWNRLLFPNILDNSFAPASEPPASSVVSKALSEMEDFGDW